MSAAADEELEELAFEVYRDSTNPNPECPEYFAVLSGPGPRTPRGTLAAVQDAVDDEEFDLEDGEGLNPAGTVTYRPGKEDGEVVSVDVDA